MKIIRVRNNCSSFKHNSVVAIENFISTDSTFTISKSDGWTLIRKRGGYVARHGHTILVMEDQDIHWDERYLVKVEKGQSCLNLHAVFLPKPINCFNLCTFSLVLRSVSSTNREMTE